MGNSYKIMCEKGEEDRIVQLSQVLNLRLERISNLVTTKTSEMMIFILTMLELIDDLESLTVEIKNLENENYTKDATIKCIFSCIESLITKLEENKL